MNSGPLYSICISHYNNARTVEKSLSSILEQIDDRFEVVVVDNFSNDGSVPILKKFEDTGKISLIQEHSSIGKARQIAFERSRGDYIISNMDFDDIFDTRLNQIVSQYHLKCEGMLLWAQSVIFGKEWAGSFLTISPRSLISSIGGWHDLQRGEDFEIAARAAKIGKYRWSEYPLLLEYNSHQERSASFNKSFFRYVAMRDFLRAGRAPFRKDEHISLGQKLSLFMAKMALPFYPKYLDPFNSTFSPLAPELYVDLGYQIQRSSM